MQKLTAIWTILILSVLNTLAQPLESFDLDEVRLLENDFQRAQAADMEYILALDMDKLLSPYLREAGLEPKAESYGNWENTGLDGHIGGHYLSALAMMFAATGDAIIKERLDYYLLELKRAQDASGNGYLGGIPGSKAMWSEIANGKIDAGRFGLNNRWVPLYNIHKIYAGLRDAYYYTDNELAKEMLIDLADWMLAITKDLSDDQIQQMLYSEHGGLNETFADVYEITEDVKYLELAKRFSDREILDPLLANKDDLTGRHANTQIPKVIGYKRIADLSDDNAWDDASRFFWNDVVTNRTVSIGGNSVREHFHPIDDYSSMISSEQGPETCNTYNMLRLTRMLFLSDPSVSLMDYYERAMYNHILSTVEPERSGFVYFTPMRPGHYRVYSQPQTSFWCCVGSGLENHTKYGELIYAHQAEDLYVNLFISSVLDWRERGITVEQQTNFPDQETSKLIIKSKKKQKFKISIRNPAWLASEMKLAVNGQSIEYQTNGFGYASVDRKWKNGDEVTITLPMKTTVEQLPDRSNYYSILHGPIVLAAKTTEEDLVGLYADDSRGGHVASGPQYPLQDMPVILSKPNEIVKKVTAKADEPLTFNLISLSNDQEMELIPFYRLHNSRYIVYWPSETEVAYEEKQKSLKKSETEKMALDKVTIDMVYPGEQQPESDHFVESEQSNIGVHSGKHWRDATGWFSYLLKDPDHEAKRLRVLYWGQDKGRSFEILINDMVIAEEVLDGSHGAEFFSVDYSLPPEILQQQKETLSVKFKAKNNAVAGGVYEVRLLR